MRTLQLAFAVVLAATAFVSTAWAVDGVILIDQNRARAGNVTPGDAPGFPISITQPGSYRLSSNLYAKDQNTDVIVITSDHVSIDLNGFTILGTADCSALPCKNTGKGRGIATGTAAANRADFFNIAIRNGVIQGMGDAGIQVLGDSVTIEHIQSRSNGGSGIDVFKQAVQQFSVMVRHNTATLNGFNGITLAGGGAVTDNVCASNALSGISFPFGANPTPGTVARNVLTNNGQYGVLVVVGPVNLIGNSMVGNGLAPSFGGVNQGQNLCNNAACPGAVF